MGLCGSHDINVKEGFNSNLTFDLNGNQLDDSDIYSERTAHRNNSIRAYNNKKIFEFEIEAFLGEREYPIYIPNQSKIEIKVFEDKNYLWAFLPEEKMVSYKGYSDYKYNNNNLGCLLVRISTSHDCIPVDKCKFKFTSEEQGSLVISANLDMNNYLFYEPKGSLKLIIKGGELYDIKMLDVLTNYDIDIGDIKKKDEKAYSEINLSILRYINKARINLKQYINDFILDNKFSENDELNIENKKLSQFEIEHKLYKVAEAHCKDLCNNGTSGHVGSDNSTLENRIEKFKIKSKKYDECIIFGYNNPISIVNSLIINKYSKKKKERKIFLNNNYKKIGISLGEHICYGYCCVIVFSE